MLFVIICPYLNGLCCTWQECRDFAVFIGGANPSVRDNGIYGKAHYEDVCRRFGDSAAIDKYETIFIDSITVAGRLCLQWCKSQPQAVSERTGKEDMRSMYGLHGQEMITWLTHLQHARAKNTWFVGILEEKQDEYNRRTFGLQIDGSKTANELPGIVDQVITMAQVKIEGKESRAFINHTLNPYGYPAKDRSGKLEMIEPPHLGNLMAKIKGSTKPIYKDLNQQVTTITKNKQQLIKE
ncbi:ATP-binding protein [Rickettsia endosymbiont of Orchestes rusci]|uniref:ATP-binding protein n=1 Tax=Rickettsia endosymbiont of Orchestes rusci TaxID=3066250 RepID=UPI00313ADC81